MTVSDILLSRTTRDPPCRAVSNGKGNLYELIVNDRMFDDHLQVEEEPWKEQVNER